MAKGLPQVAKRPRAEAPRGRRAKQRGDDERRALARQKELELLSQLYGDHTQKRTFDGMSTCSGSEGGDSSDEDSEGAWEPPAAAAGVPLQAAA
eukprot:5894513-Pyramimonas_sp.AAC.1